MTQRRTEDLKTRRQAHRKAVGRRIASARKAAKLTQAELAAKAGVDPQHLSKQERGFFLPSADTLLRIADACSVDPRWLALVDDDDAPRTGTAG